jgi:hypothetical protein
MVEKLAEGLYKVTAVITNNSFMPTYGCQMAVNAGRTKPLTVELKVVGDGAAAGSSDGGIAIVTGKAKQEIPHLPGLSGGGRGGMGWYGGSMPGNHKDVEWIVRAKAGTKISVVAESMKAGVDSMEVTVE